MLLGKRLDACIKKQTSQNINLMLTYIDSNLLFILKLTVSNSDNCAQKRDKGRDQKKNQDLTLFLWQVQSKTSAFVRITNV